MERLCLPAEASIALLAVLLLAIQEGHVPQVLLYLCRSLIAASSLLCWRKSGMLIFVPGSRRPDLCPALPMAVKIFEKGKKQLKVLVKRQECPQKKSTWQQSRGKHQGFSARLSWLFGTSDLQKNLRCSSSLCLVTPLVITEPWRGL